MSVPPSYESVVAELHNQVGPNPTAKDYIALANALPAYKKDILTTGAANAPPTKLTAEQLDALQHGVGKTLATDEGIELLKSGARLAVTACKEIESQFTSLLIDLAKIDARNEPPAEGAFCPRLEAFRKEYRSNVTKSKDLALEIAVYGQDFDETIIPLCADDSLTIADRKQQLGLFIDQATKFSDSTQEISNTFDSLSTKFTAFVGSFSGWAASKTQQLNADLKAANEHLVSLQTHLKNLTIATGVLVGLEVAGVVAIGAAFFCPVIGPVLALSGMITAGLSALGGVGCAIGMAIVESQIEDEQRNIADIQSKLDDIAATRSNLELTGRNHLNKFKTHISAIEAVWTRAHKDAKQIESWLERAEKTAGLEKPTYMRGQLKHSINIYSKMAIYLEEYATGLVDAKMTGL